MVVMSKERETRPATSSRREVDQFLEKVARTPAVRSSDPEARLLFGMDATASREPTWDRACHLQAMMFEATDGLGNLSVQLCYYRGFNEFNKSSWCKSADQLQRAMTGVRCLGGFSQIHRVLKHAQSEHRTQRVRALVFVGDAIEEDADALCHLAGQLGVLGVPLFMFQEGADPGVRSVFQQMAQLSGGAWAPFDLNSANELKDLLSAVAVFATGGRKALEQMKDRPGPAGLLTQIK